MKYNNARLKMLRPMATVAGVASVNSDQSSTARLSTGWPPYRAAAHPPRTYAQR